MTPASERGGCATALPSLPDSISHMPFSWPTIRPTWCGQTTTAPIPAGPGCPHCAQLRARLNAGPGRRRRAGAFPNRTRLRDARPIARCPPALQKTNIAAPVPAIRPAPCEHGEAVREPARTPQKQNWPRVRPITPSTSLRSSPCCFHIPSICKRKPRQTVRSGGAMRPKGRASYQSTGQFTRCLCA